MSLSSLLLLCRSGLLISQPQTYSGGNPGGRGLLLLLGPVMGDGRATAAVVTQENRIKNIRQPHQSSWLKQKQNKESTHLCHHRPARLPSHRATRTTTTPTTPWD